MGIFTPKENVELTELKEKQTSSMVVCPSCLQEFEASGATLQAANPVLGLTMHKCPKCGALVSA